MRTPTAPAILAPDGKRATQGSNMERRQRIAVLTVMLVFGIAAIAPGVADARFDRGVRMLAGRASGTEVVTPIAGTRLGFVVDLKGRLTHLGKVTIHGAGEDSLAGTRVTVYKGTVTIRTKRGDELRSTVAGNGAFDPSTLDVRFELTYVFTGGTGRFKRARGAVTVRGAATFLGVDAATSGLRYHDVSTYRGWIAWRPRAARAPWR
jgi:hypothetical protein